MLLEAHQSVRGETSAELRASSPANATWCGGSGRLFLGWDGGAGDAAGDLAGAADEGEVAAELFLDQAADQPEAEAAGGGVEAAGEEAGGFGGRGHAREGGGRVDDFEFGAVVGAAGE